jgi:hypothetical protein
MLGRNIEEGRVVYDGKGVDGEYRGNAEESHKFIGGSMRFNTVENDGIGLVKVVVRREVEK